MELALRIWMSAMSVHWAPLWPPIDLRMDPRIHSKPQKKVSPWRAVIVTLFFCALGAPEAHFGHRLGPPGAHSTALLIIQSWGISVLSLLMTLNWGIVFPINSNLGRDRQTKRRKVCFHLLYDKKYYIYTYIQICIYIYIYISAVRVREAFE